MKRILFVDDEPNILSGLRRLLRPYREVWNMSFASSGDEALAFMDQEPFDVVVTDMKMPGMNGADLLRQVQEQHPRTVRIVLSGQGDMEAAMRSVIVSHQYLAKPCDPGELEAVIERACGLEELLSEPALQELLGTIGELPAVPRTYRKLILALGQEEVDLQELGRIVEQDLGIASKVLQLVNSSFFGIRREISDIRQAVSYLGVRTLRDLTLSVEVFKQFEGARNSGFSIEREQEHSMLSARIARRLLENQVSREQATLAAMLHDLGRLVLASHAPKRSRAIQEAYQSGTRPIHEVEEEQLGVSHAEIGAYLLGLWGMPYPIVEAVAYHHCPSKAPNSETFAVLGATHVANALAREQEGEPPETIAWDLDYLEATDRTADLEDWRRVAAEEAGAT